MTNVLKSLIWASIIILVAWNAKEQGMSDSASMGLTFGLMGAAIASLSTGKGCRTKGCF